MVQSLSTATSWSNHHTTQQNALFNASLFPIVNSELPLLLLAPTIIIHDDPKKS